MLGRSSLGVRLTRWYAAVLAVVLALYAGGIVLFIDHRLSKQLDRELREDFEFAEGMLVRTAGSGVGWRGDDAADDEAGDLHAWVEVWSRDGQLLYHSGSSAEGERGATLASVAPRRFGFHSGTFPGAGSVRLLNGPSSVGGLPVVIRVARSAQGVRHELTELLLLLALGFPLGIAAAAFGGHALARRALAPVNRMTEQAQQMTAERLGDALEVVNPDDEIGQLARVLNDALSRLDRSFGQLRSFAVDASLALRAPLTAIRRRGEVGLRERRDEAGYREVVAGMLEDAEWLAKLVERLLTKSQGNTGQVALTCERTDLGVLGREVASQLRVLAEERQQSIAVEVPGRVYATVDRVVFREAILQLADDAIKYSPAGASIRIVVVDDPDGPRIEVQLVASGFPPEYRDGAFAAFAGSHKPTSPPTGIGLGCSMARWIVEAHGGRISMDDSEGGGSTFRIVLPSQGTQRTSRASL